MPGPGSYLPPQDPCRRKGDKGEGNRKYSSLPGDGFAFRVFKNADALHEDVASAMQPPLAAVETDVTLDEVFATLTGRTNAVVVASKGKPIGVLTRSDLLDFLAHQRG